MFNVSAVALILGNLIKPTPIIEDYLDPRWKWFKGCLGALDGTFIDVRVPEHEDVIAYERAKWRSMSWVSTIHLYPQQLEGSAADSRVLCDTIHRDAGLCVPTDILNTGNYYLCDNRYANADGFLTPSQGVRYHLREWDRGAGDPRNTEELFNLKHSSTRNVIERKFGLLKVRWGILRNQSFYSIEVQDKIIIACCLLHNFIQNEMPDDPLELEIPDARDSVDETNVECISTIEK
ncbi:UNVERIFIED_CONTAM: hypothetical protein Sradi_4883300 [Sesamum radiatum]|uniref:DDE Tnp4 domain-containing protein n=1 Tax=Sesamum radiatum TaxID=300843 RepID=A0AAW2N1C7_SESRA